MYDGLHTDTSVSVAASSDLHVLWTQFAGRGAFSSAQQFQRVAAANGAVAVTEHRIPPGGNATLSIVFAWYDA
jgi:hypothetical protein